MARTTAAPRSRGTQRTVLPRAKTVQRRAGHRAWVAAFVIGVLLAAGGMFLTVAPTIGLGRTLGISAVLPARAALTVAAAGLGLVCALCSVTRRGRFLLPVAAALLVVAVFNVPVVMFRGFGSSTVTTNPAGRVAVLEWNTNGDLVSPSAIAALAAGAHADIVVLPDAGIGTTAADYRAAFASSGLDMRLYSGEGPSAQTAVLVTGRLAARYPGAQAGPDPDTSLVLQPTSSTLPTIVALHAAQPTPGSITRWRDELDWVATRCAAASVLVSGDFNASVDDFGASSLGGCRDSAVAAGAASVGTWPTALPSFLGMPIDHTLVTSGVGTVDSFTVLGSEDSSGARHRPTLTVLSTSWSG